MFDRKVFYGSLFGLALAFIGSNLFKLAVPRPVAPELLTGNVSVIANYSVFDHLKPFGGYDDPFDFLHDRLCMETTQSEAKSYGLEEAISCFCQSNNNACYDSSIPQIWSNLSSWLECQAGQNCKSSGKAPLRPTDLDPAHWTSILSFANTCQCHYTSLASTCTLGLPKTERVHLSTQQWSLLGRNTNCDLTVALPDIQISLKRHLQPKVAASMINWHLHKEKRTESSEGLTRQQLIDVLGCPSHYFVNGICLAGPPPPSDDVQIGKRQAFGVDLAKRTESSEGLTRQQLIDVLGCPSHYFVNGICLAGPPPDDVQLGKRQGYNVHEEHWDAFTNLLREHYCAGVFQNGICVAGPPKKRNVYDVDAFATFLDSLTDSPAKNSTVSGNRFAVRAIPNLEEQFYFPIDFFFNSLCSTSVVANEPDAAYDKICGGTGFEDVDDMYRSVKQLIESCKFPIQSTPEWLSSNDGNCRPDYSSLNENDQTSPEHWGNVLECIEQCTDGMQDCPCLKGTTYLKDFFWTFSCFDGYFDQGSCTPYVTPDLRRSLPGSYWKAIASRHYGNQLSRRQGYIYPTAHTGDPNADQGNVDNGGRKRRDSAPPDGEIERRFYVPDPGSNPPGPGAPDGNTNNGRRFYVPDPGSNPPGPGAPDGNTNNGRRFYIPDPGSNPPGPGAPDGNTNNGRRLRQRDELQPAPPPDGSGGDAGNTNSGTRTEPRSASVGEFGQIYNTLLPRTFVIEPLGGGEDKEVDHESETVQFLQQIPVSCAEKESTESKAQCLTIRPRVYVASPGYLPTHNQNGPWRDGITTEPQNLVNAAARLV